MVKDELENYKNKFSNLNILYVEDDDIASSALLRVLKMVSDSVILATNGEDGLKAFSENRDKINLVITDIQMPKMSGIEMIKEIKKISNPQIIILTAFGDKNTFIESINAGVDKYILKPIDVKQLLLRVKECHSIIELKNKIVKQNELLLAKSRQAAMGEMIGNIAHQWRQPLNALGLLMYNVYEDFHEYDEKKMDKYYSEMRVMIEQMSTTIDDFRNFFKIDKKRENFNLITTIEDTLKIFNASLKNNNIKLLKEYKSRDIEFFGYKNEFSQVIVNLLSNAKDELIKNSIEKREIKICVDKKENEIVIKIFDNGGGIDESIIHKIFEPYFTTKDEDKGSGIGLYMSKVIIEKNMGGKLNAININGGAMFEIRLYLTTNESK